VVDLVCYGDSPAKCSSGLLSDTQTVHARLKTSAYPSISVLCIDRNLVVASDISKKYRSTETELPASRYWVKGHFQPRNISSPFSKLL
jgi:hypothetical protein